MSEDNFESVPFTNIDREDFTWEWGGKPYTIKAGETKFYPPFLANHFAKHLTDKLMQEAGVSLRELQKRQEFVDRMLANAEEPAPEVESKPLTKKPVVVKKKVQPESESASPKEEQPFAGINN